MSRKTKNVRFRHGRYYYRYSVKDPGTGKRVQKEAGPYASEREAEREGILIVAEILNGTYINDKKKTLEIFAEEWLSMYEATNIKARTIDIRRSNVKKIKELMGGMLLTEITSAFYQNVLNTLKDKGKSQSYLKSLHSVMRMIFKKALELDLIKKDITNFVRVPSYLQTVEEIENSDDLPVYLEKEQLAKLLKATAESDNIQYHRIIVLLVYTGMRIGELLALKLTDIDEVNKRISVTKTLYLSGSVKNFKLNTPKNKSSIRKIDVSQRVINVIKEQISWKQEFKMQYRKWFNDEHNFLFFNDITKLGYPLNPSIVRDYLSAILEQENLPQSITPHSLRHTYTSLMAESGVELPAIQQLLGHKDDKTTRLIYLHVTTDKKRAAVEKFDALMDGVL